MFENLFPYFVAWAALAVVVVGLAVYRWVVGLHEDDTIHISDPKFQVEQGAFARKLDGIEKWGKSLTAIVGAGGLALAVAFLYRAWIANSTIGMVR